MAFHNIVNCVNSRMNKFHWNSNFKLKIQYIFSNQNFI